MERDLSARFHVLVTITLVAKFFVGSYGACSQYQEERRSAVARHANGRLRVLHAPGNCSDGAGLRRVASQP